MLRLFNLDNNSLCTDSYKTEEELFKKSRNGFPSIRTTSTGVTHRTVAPRLVIFPSGNERKIPATPKGKKSPWEQ